MEDKTNLLRSARLAALLNENPQSLSPALIHEIPDIVKDALDNADVVKQDPDGIFHAASGEDLDDDEFMTCYEACYQNLFQFLQKIPVEAGGEEVLKAMDYLVSCEADRMGDSFEVPKYFAAYLTYADQIKLSDRLLYTILDYADSIILYTRDENPDPIVELIKPVKNPVNVQALQDLALSRVESLLNLLHSGRMTRFEYEDARTQIPAWLEIGTILAIQSHQLEKILHLPLWDDQREMWMMQFSELYARVMDYGEPEDLEQLIRWAADQSCTFLPLHHLFNQDFGKHAYRQEPFLTHNSLWHSPARRYENERCNAFEPVWYACTNNLPLAGHFKSLAASGHDPINFELISPSGVKLIEEFEDVLASLIIDRQSIPDLGNARGDDLFRDGSTRYKEFIKKLRRISAEGERFGLSLAMQMYLLALLNSDHNLHHEYLLASLVDLHLSFDQEYGRILDFAFQREVDPVTLKALIQLAAIEIKEYASLDELAIIMLMNRLPEEDLELFYDIVLDQAADLKQSQIWKPNFNLESLIFKGQADLLGLAMLASGFQIHPTAEVLDAWRGFTSMEMRIRNAAGNPETAAYEQVIMDQILDYIHQPQKKMEVESFYESLGLAADADLKEKAARYMKNPVESADAEGDYDDTDLVNFLAGLFGMQTDNSRRNFDSSSSSAGSKSVLKNRKKTPAASLDAQSSSQKARKKSRDKASKKSRKANRKKKK